VSVARCVRQNPQNSSSQVLRIKGVGQIAILKMIDEIGNPSQTESN
jgi:hypothetical protein